jgi:hypothetical protein
VSRRIELVAGQIAVKHEVYIILSARPTFYCQE